MSDHKKVANTLGGKTARACDNCICKRARWYCASDDAFLCQECDASVHSANPLARRHERVRLKTASLKPNEEEDLPLENSLIPWHRGFSTRKARTPRQANKQTNRPSPPSNKTEESMQNPVPLVPEMGSEEASPDENDEEHLLYRVPVFDPFGSKLCTSAMSNEAATGKTTGAFVRKESEALSLMDYGNDETGIVDDVPDDFLLSSNMDLEEVAVDFESLFDCRPDEHTFEMKEFGLLSNLKDEEGCEVYCFGKGRIKLEKQDELGDDATTCHANPELEITKETLDWNFNHDSPATGEEDEEDKKEMVVARSSAAMTMNGGAYKTEEITKKMLLSLDYGGVITAWASKGSPWITGKRPEFNQDDSWPGFMGNCSQRDANDPTYFDVWGSAKVGGQGDREAKVSRYREKRRTRLFSKKIRYEVRKLNAEKRPRMKGRFVKRACFAVGLPTFSF